SETCMLNVSFPLYPVAGVYVSPAGATVPPVDVPASGKPPKAPCAGPDSTVHVSVCAVSVSFICNNELIGLGPESWHTVRLKGLPPEKAGAVFDGAEPDIITR